MEKQELFRIFDACLPTVALVREYLERISGKSPFDLIFTKDGKQTITKKLDYNMGCLIGIVIEKTIFYTQTLSKKDLEDNQRLTQNDVYLFGKNIYPAAYPLTINDIKLLGKHREEYASLCDMAKVFGYSIPALQDYYLSFDDDKDSVYAKLYDIFGEHDGTSDIAHSLNFRDILFCTSW